MASNTKVMGSISRETDQMYLECNKSHWIKASAKTCTFNQLIYSLAVEPMTLMLLNACLFELLEQRSNHLITVY